MPPKYYCVPDVFNAQPRTPTCDDCGAPLTHGYNHVFGATICPECYNNRMWDFCASR